MTLLMGTQTHLSQMGFKFFPGYNFELEMAGPQVNLQRQHPLR